MNRLVIALGLLVLAFSPALVSHVHSQIITGCCGAQDGTVANPGFFFSAQPGMGIRRSGQSAWVFQSDGGAATVIWANAGSNYYATFQNEDTNSSPGSFAAISNGTVGGYWTSTNPGYSIGAAAANGGQRSGWKYKTELTTIAAAASTNTVITIPANSLVYAVSVRVVTVIPTCATFTVTSASPARTWNTAAVNCAAGSTDTGVAGGMTVETAASVVTITPNAVPGAGTGQVRVTIHYFDVTPPTL